MSKLIVFISACLVLQFTYTFGQNERVIRQLHSADQAVKADKFGKALKKYEKILKISPENKHALIGMAYTSSVIGQNQRTNAKKRKYYQQSMQYAQKAYQLSSMSTDANYMMALIKDKQAEFAEAEERIRLAKEMQEHANYTLKFEQENAGAYFLLGRSYFLLATLPFDSRAEVERGIPAQRALELAIENFQKAIKLDPNRVLYYYSLALAYEEDLKIDKALDAVNRALSLEPTPEDGGTSLIMRCQELKFMIN
ncbi:MAG: tetratricopeptide repeat protein [Bacteroidetes bacterium]|nr:MAG: tetratricopeptide repeat protein [Bacteroidota bacterium]